MMPETATAGLSYQSGQWNKISDSNSKFEFIAPIPRFEANFRAYIGPILEFKLYETDIINGYAELNGYMEFSLDLSFAPIWSLYAGAYATAGIKSEVLDVNIELEAKIFEYKRLIAFGHILSGTWKGTRTVIKAGDCDIVGNSSSPIIMTWMVNNEGDITIQDNLQAGANWTGNADRFLNIALKKSYTALCDGTPTPGLTTYDGSVIRTERTYRFDTESTEVWCPEGNCVFLVRYSLLKE